MKPIFLFAACAATMPILTGSAFTPAGKHGYGAIDIRYFDPPQLISPRPVIANIAAAESLAKAVYLYVPQHHRASWAQSCQRYKACGYPVYFVTDKWYRRIYLPWYREEERIRLIKRQRNPGRYRGIEF